MRTNVEYSYQELMNFKESIKDGFRKVSQIYSSKLPQYPSSGIAAEAYARSQAAMEELLGSKGTPAISHPMYAHYMGPEVEDIPRDRAGDVKKKGSFLDWELDLPELKDMAKSAGIPLEDLVRSIISRARSTGVRDITNQSFGPSTAILNRSYYARPATSDSSIVYTDKRPEEKKSSSTNSGKDVITKLASIGLAEVVKESGMKSELLGSFLVPGSAIGALTALFRKKPTLLQWLARNKHTASNFIPGVGGHRLVMRAKGEPDALRIVEKAVNGLSLSDLVKKLL